MTTELLASPEQNIEQTNMLKLTTSIVAAYATRNTLSADGLAGLIQTTYNALAMLGQAVVSAPVPEQAPAVPIRKSVFPDHIICLEDGKPFKALKRHLRVAYGMTPQDYRAKWKLPPDYPMVAPNYAAYRASQARAIGLGGSMAASTSPSETDQPDATSAEDLPVDPPITRLPERQRGRRPKSA